MKLIVATDENNGIGKDGFIPWSCPEDQRFFQVMTIGETIVMGRKTFESLGSKPLRDRNNIVISSKEYSDSDFKSNLRFLNLLDFYIENPLEDYDYDNMWIIGGSEIYDVFLNTTDYINIIYRSIISGTYGCDKTFNIPEGFRLASSIRLSDRCKVEKWLLL